VSDGWDALRRQPTGKYSFWKYNWLARHKIIRALERARPTARGQLLDIGCGSRPFAFVLERVVERYWGTDLRSSGDITDRLPDFYSVGEALPVRAGAMDTVLGLSMLTYVEEPLRVLEEAHRVLRPGGHLIMEFTQMAAVLDHGHDFFRFTQHGAELLVRRAGFEPVASFPIGGLWSRVGLNLIARLNRLNRGAKRVITEVPVRVAYVVIQLACEGLDRLLPTPAERLAHLVVARRPNGAGSAVGAPGARGASTTR
jgi:SAM-dependent methyltransferase